jgi:hypothetical protein
MLVWKVILSWSILLYMSDRSGASDAAFNLQDDFLTESYLSDDQSHITTTQLAIPFEDVNPSASTVPQPVLSTGKSQVNMSMTTVYPQSTSDYIAADDLVPMNIPVATYPPPPPPRVLPRQYLVSRPNRGSRVGTNTIPRSIKLIRGRRARAAIPIASVATVTTTMLVTRITPPAEIALSSAIYSVLSSLAKNTTTSSWTVTIPKSLWSTVTTTRTTMVYITQPPSTVTVMLPCSSTNTVAPNQPMTINNTPASIITQPLPSDATTIYSVVTVH